MSLDRFVADASLSGNRILPQTGVAKVRVEANLDANVFGQSSSCPIPVLVEFTVRGPSYATATMVPPTKTILVDGASSSGSQTSRKTFPVATDLEISVGRDAPAFADGLYDVTMQARSQSSSAGTQCSLGDSRPVTATYRLKNDFSPRTAVVASSSFATVGPDQKVVFPITVSNLGNGPARVSVRLESTQGTFAALSSGPDLRLDPQSDATASLEATTPIAWGYTNSISTFKATITTTYDGTATGTLNQDTTVVTFTVKVQGAYVSAALLFFVAAALLGAYFALGLPLSWRRVGPAAAWSRLRKLRKRDEELVETSESTRTGWPQHVGETLSIPLDRSGTSSPSNVRKPMFRRPGNE